MVRESLNERFVEGKQLVLRFPDIESQVIEQFLYYLFYGTLPLGNLPIDKESDEFEKYTLLAVRLWMFGDRHFLPKLQNLAMRQVHASATRRYPTMRVLGEAFETSAPGSALRKLMIREFVYGLCEKQREGDPTAGYNPSDAQVLEHVPGFAVEFAEQTATVTMNINTFEVEMGRSIPLNAVLVNEGDALE